ncbi:hypothetical protein HY212_05905 [Candidatus Pacearchaeota archaeon]|nr:hypothetical protein [Candidatus Pacearchaeota archaeon]
MKRGLSMILGFVIVVSMISFVSASFFSNLFKPSGQASFGSQDVSVTVAGTNAPTIDQPSAAIANQNPTEGTTTAVAFQVVVTDLDGVANINDASLIARVSRGATTRTATCINPTNVDSDTRSYDCTVNMQYYDDNGAWDFYGEIKDQETNTGTRTVVPYLTYNLLTSMQVPLSPATLGWPSLSPGASNVLSNNDPTNVVNTGNYNGNVFLQAYYLQGQTTSSEIIPVNVFSVDSATGGAPPSECDVGVTAVQLGPADGNTVDTGISSNKGNPSGANVYYCITSVPLVSSQIYSTSTRGAGFSWRISYQ